MTEARRLVDPTGERNSGTRPRAERLDRIDGKVVGLLDISKARGDVFLDRLAELLADRGARVLRYEKPTFAKPAPVDLRRQIGQQCDAVIEALAD